MYDHDLHYYYNYTGTIAEGPSNVTYLSGVTPLPIELICNATEVPSWRVNGTSYTLRQLTDGELRGHNRTGTNILVNSPMNNTEYICFFSTIDDDIISDPAYVVIVAGEYDKCHICIIACIWLHVCMCSLFCYQKLQVYSSYVYSYVATL